MLTLAPTNAKILFPHNCLQIWLKECSQKNGSEQYVCFGGYYCVDLGWKSYV